MWTNINRFATAGLVALTIAGTTIATTSQAEARNNFGRGLAAGIAGTIIGGALIAGARHPAMPTAPPITRLLMVRPSMLRRLMARRSFMNPSIPAAM
ncbi:hypothetical protein C241_13352 [Bradyrhizobium lupini HPC(L)]|uniref:Transmembrane protein n=1 Tax=Bradyrhizobium lupini HPC(L) TaxID=1229491 RepID=A0ABP2RS62_RHILU|nr:hypothetical protein C241_13352 [Bradyrhizobium lupini HPC(L)]